MKSFSFLTLAAVYLFSPFSLSAQLTPEQRIQDSIIGWDPDNYFDRNYKPQTTVAGKQKETYLDKFTE